MIDPKTSISECISIGAEGLTLSLSGIQVDLLSRYVALLVKWNKTYNLTSVRDPVQMVSRHVIDSLSIAPFVKSDNMLDIGSGPGLPGIPLAILYPDKLVSTLDSNGKKTRFMTHVKMELGLNNLTVINSRVECYQTESLFSEVTSRAFSSLIEMVQKVKHLLRDSGVYLAMKGRYPNEEINELTKHTDCELVKVVSLHVPDNVGVRHLVILRKQ
ncbi:MAG: 16S rRNA (guanine(527)-N(7))-methyltransferase RsmG [Candidatus Endonucleobacter bathymodioli]|uniref:Ribosomal RNA small subunit methyltransferase G n=1 Tax=Candidatus Endonucleibacter bathymodioli TaxID=539814 RepID=A0AA90SLN3_9GAMM|nr:16S rRNA (guanine(527)-N(7))-methyltransferase RsmG [Candidatus Endonucleobacter bathymodioli]MDP0590314.1 16S rRNA (guanine(527)-N(7))-methyltransferase RsmG [Candidatus Endonucleobacter bathymodioli]